MNRLCLKMLTHSTLNSSTFTEAQQSFPTRIKLMPEGTIVNVDYYNLPVPFSTVRASVVRALVGLAAALYVDDPRTLRLYLLERRAEGSADASFTHMIAPLSNAQRFHL